MKKDAKTFGGMFAKLGGLYAEEEKRAGAEKASGDAKEPIDIGGGFTMEEVTGEPEGDEPEGPEGDVKAV